MAPSASVLKKAREAAAKLEEKEKMMVERGEGKDGGHVRTDATTTDAE